MVKLLDGDIRTREVLDWKGIHLFHFQASSCSQKTRMFMNLKGIDWEPHHISLPENENFTPWYLGINPRGLVPALVMDGEVHIESNDIIQLLDARFPDNRLVPDGMEDRMAELLHHEDDLHLDIRTISFQFGRPGTRTPKSEEALENYRQGGSGTVLGKEDPNKAREIAFWENAADGGITDEMVRVSAAKLRAALEELDDVLSGQPYLMGDALSVLDIAWFVYVNRLARCLYPLERLHPNVDAWFQKLRERDELTKETAPPPDFEKAFRETQAQQIKEGRTFADVTGF